MIEPDGAEAIARNIRRLRDRQGISLSELARRSGIAKATLSAIEQGDGNPTIATLHALADALGVPVSEIVARGGVDGRQLVRGAAGEPGTDDVPIESFVPEGVVELYDLRYEPGDEITFEGHEAGVVERVLVQSGTLRAGPTDDPQVLEAGDYLTFPADRRHVVETVGDDAVRGTLIVTYPVSAPTDSPIHGDAR